MMEAKLYNPTIDIFRRNEYIIQYLHQVSDLVPNGAAVDLCVPSPSPLYALAEFWKNQDFMDLTLFDCNKAVAIAALKKQIAVSGASDESFFNFTYFKKPGHSSSRSNIRSRKIINEKLGEFRDTYGQAINAANREIVDFLQFIIENDPDSIILLIGDHGSWGFRLKEDRNGNPISNEVFILDRFGVFAAMRAPKGLSRLIENGTVKSHVNIFRYVFAYLSGDNAILKTEAADNSYERQFLMAIKDGKILDKFIRIELEPAPHKN